MFYQMLKGRRVCLSAAIVVQVVLFLFSIVFLPVPNKKVEAAVFSDLNGHWAAAEICAAAEAGYIHGYPDRSFRPEREITRAEFASIINNFYGFEMPTNPAGYGDVRENDWYFSEVSKATAAGYFNGYPGGVFRPAAEITRQEAAGVLGKMLLGEEIAGEEGLLKFNDAAQIGAWAKPAVAGLVARDLFAGYPDSTFRPRRAVTRAEAAVLLLKVEKYLQERLAGCYLEVKGEHVNKRTGPGESFAVLGQVEQKEVYEAISFCNGWFKVGGLEGDGAEGWIAGWLLQEHDAPLPAPPPPPVPPEKPVENLDLAIEVLPGERALTVSLCAGEDAEYRWEKEEETNKLKIFVTGIKPLAASQKIPVGQAGLEQIVSRPAAGENGDGRAEVEFEFIREPVPVVYNVEEKPGRLLVVVPHQLLEVEIEESGDLVRAYLQATVPLDHRAFVLYGPRRIVIDLPNLVLNPVLKDWKTEFDLPFLCSLRLGQFQPEVARLVADLNGAASYQVTPGVSSHALILEFGKATVRGKRVCLDPGHGGTDPGAVGPSGLREKDVNLPIALCAAKLLRAAGMEVIMTREDDRYVDLTSRAEIANNCGADVFVSIHADAVLNKPTVGGTSTYTYSIRQKAEREHLSRLLQAELVAALGRQDRGVFDKNFAVLRETKMPAALVEVAYISNPEEEKLLADEAFQQRAAGALAQAIKRFFLE